jgi:hypothetical protein
MVITYKQQLYFVLRAFAALMKHRCDAHIFDKSISELRVATSRDAKHHLMDVVTEANLPLFSSYKVSTVLKHPAS